MKHISEILADLSNPNRRAPASASTEKPLGRENVGVVGVPTGFSDIDQLTGGLQRSDLIVVASRSSMGKTSLSLGMAYGATVGHDKVVGFFTLETSSEQLVLRLLAMDTGIDSQRVRRGLLDDNEWDRVSRAFGRLGAAPFFIDDTATTVADIRRRAHRLKVEQGLDIVVVDCIQFIDDEEGIDRKRTISDASRILKVMACELDVPVVVLSQVSWDVESRIDHRPVLADMSESGSLSTDADLVAFLYREEKYEEDSEKPGVAEVIIAKHRNGPVGSVNLRFFERTARFADLELYPEPRL